MLYSLLHAAQSLEQRLEATLGEVSLSCPKFSALTELARAEEPLTLTELAGRLTCVRSNVTQLVDRLEADGLVRRVEDARDRRSVRAELTPLGRQRQAAGARRVEEVQEALARELGEQGRSALERALARLG